MCAPPKMKFNQKELIAFAAIKSGKSDKEGFLYMKDSEKRKDGMFAIYLVSVTIILSCIFQRIRNDGSVCVAICCSIRKMIVKIRQ